MAADHARKGFLMLIGFLAPSVLVGIVVAVAMSFHTVTEVAISFNTSRLAFEMGGSDPKTLLNSPNCDSITLSKFESISLFPQVLTASDSRGRGRGLVCKSIASDHGVKFEGNDGFVTFQPSIEAEQDHRVIKLDSIQVRPGSRVVLEATEERRPTLNIHIYGQQSSALISPGGPFTIEATSCRISGVDCTLDGDHSLVFTAQLMKAEPLIKARGKERSFVVSASIVPERSPSFIPRGVIPITTIDLTSQDPLTGAPTSALSDGIGGTLSYPGYPELKPEPFEAPDILTFEGLGTFYLEEIRIDEAAKGMAIRLRGQARVIRIGQPAAAGTAAAPARDYGLTLFDVLWKDRRLGVWFGIIVWIAGTTIAGYKLFKEVRRVRTAGNGNGG